jgi:galactan 5-O-arabinofuranosyltransferase
LFGAEVVAAVVAAAMVSVLVQWIVNRLPIPHRSNVPTALTWSVVLVLGCVTLTLLWRRWSRTATIAGWILPGALTSIVQALELFGTPLYLNGTGGDQFFRMQYLQRLTVSASLADDNYSGLPPYYPAGWFWLGGRFANLLGHPAWAAYKPFAILSIAAVASLTFVLWSLVTSRRRALGIATALALAATIYGAYEPYRWLAMVCLIPTAVLAWRLFMCIAGRGGGAAGHGPAVVLIGIGLSITAATYTLVFIFGVLLLVVIAVAAVVVRRFDRNLEEPDGRSTFDLVKTATLKLILIGLVALPITLLVWAPYLYALIRLPAAGNAAAQAFPLGAAKFGTPALQPTIVGAICMVGLVWLIIAWRRSTIAQAFSVILLACVVWQLLSTALLFGDTTLLPAYIAQVGEVVLWCACALGLFDLVVFVRRREDVGNRLSVQALASVLAVLVAVALMQAAPRSDLLPAAFNAYDANGHAANDTGSPGRFNKQLIDSIAQLSGRPPQDNIVLTNNYQLLVFQPYYSFQTSKEQYANPLARYPERIQELENWARSATSAELVAKMAASEFEAPNVFVLGRDNKGGYPYVSEVTDFPYKNKKRKVTFSSELFASPYFESRVVGPYTVIVRADSNDDRG